jgi:uncharacterized protein YcbX
VIGKIESLWRYPVKSMAGERLNELFVGFSGVYGDRLFEFHSSASPKGFPYLTARNQRKMLCCRPHFRHPDRAARPANLAEAEAMGPGINPLAADPPDLMVDVETPEGRRFAIDNPALIGALREGLAGGPELKLLRSERAMTDCRPVSLFSLQTARQLSDELGSPVDLRRFRANIYLDLIAANGFGEDQYVGRSLRLGSKAVVAILERDPRCAMITLDADTGEPNPNLLRQLAQAHKGTAGVYGAVLVEGTVRVWDTVELVG